MKIEKQKTKLKFNGAKEICQIAVVCLLTSCGDGGDSSDEITENNDTSSSTQLTLSAAQLSNDDTVSLSAAQASASDVNNLAETVTLPTSSPLVVDQPVNQPSTVLTVDSTSQTPTSQPVVGIALPETVFAEQQAVSNPETAALPVSEPEPEPLPVAEIEPEPEPAPEPAPDPEPVPAPTAEPETESVESEMVTSPTVENNAKTRFTSSTTDGFTGEIVDNNSIRVRWNTDPTARGYNVYRQAKYITTVFTTEYIETDLYDQSYYYEIQAFDYDENYSYVATGLTVDVTGTNRKNPLAPQRANNILDDYELVFADEFNGSELDTSKWNTQYLWGPDLVINSEEQYYVDIANDPEFGYNPFKFNGEAVTIQSIRTPDSLLEKANRQPYLSGVMTSYDAFKFTYGYVETRAKVTYGQGYWPAFWLLNAYYVDDKPEIDIMEHIGNDQDVVYHTYHYYDADDKLRSTKSKATVGIDFSAGFHTYAVEWKPGTIVFYVDGIERHRIIDSKVSRQDMYIIANTALGGWWPGSPDATTPFPGEYTIDYIRAYQKIGPFDDIPFDDGTTQVPYADDGGGSSPNHRPPFHLWPEGYPDKQP